MFSDTPYILGHGRQVTAICPTTPRQLYESGLLFSTAGFNVRQLLVSSRTSLIDKNRSLDGILDGNESSHFSASEPINSLSGASANEEDCDDCDDCDDSKGNDNSPDPVRGSGVPPQPELTVCTNCGLGISVGLTLYIDSNRIPKSCGEQQIGRR